MTAGLFSHLLPSGENPTEFIGFEPVGSQKVLKRFSLALIGGGEGGGNGSVDVGQQIAIDALTAEISAARNGKSSLDAYLDEQRASTAAKLTEFEQETAAQFAAFGQEIRTAPERPGDAPALFSEIATGASRSQPKQTVGTVATIAAGSALIIPGGAQIWPRQDEAIYDDDLSVAEWRVRRTFDSRDPLNDTVELGITWLDKSKQRLGADQVVRRYALTIANGTLTHRVNVSAGREDADITAPAGAVYARPYVKTYGDPNSRTAIVLLELRRRDEGSAGPTGATGPVPTYEVDNELTRIRWTQPDGTIGDWLDLGVAAIRAEAAAIEAQGYAQDSAASAANAQTLVEAADAGYRGLTADDASYDFGFITDPAIYFSEDFGDIA